MASGKVKLALLLMAFGLMTGRTAWAESGEYSQEGAILKAGQNIVDTAATSGVFNTFAEAIRRADLAKELDTGGPYTLFAPVDSAFGELAPGTMESLFAPENKDSLRSWVEHYVVQGSYTVHKLSARDDTSWSVSDFGTIYSLKAVNGDDILVYRPDGDLPLEIEGGQVVQSDIHAANGIIQGIQKVWMP